MEKWTLEHVFYRFKEMFGMAKKRVIGLKKTRIHVYSCLLANLFEYAIWRFGL